MIETKYRFGLRAKIHESGHRTMGDFARAFGIDPTTLSRVVNGREIPSAPVQDSIRRGLNLDERQLRALLDA